MTSTRSSVFAGIWRRSIPPPADVVKPTPPPDPSDWRFALLETGMPSRMITVPKLARSLEPMPAEPTWSPSGERIAERPLTPAVRAVRPG